MPIIIPAGEGKKPRKNKLKGKPIKPAKAVEARYMRMFKQNATIMSEVARSVFTEIQTGRPTLTSIRARLDAAEGRILTQTAATEAATGIVESANRIQKRRFEAMLARAFGVSLINIIDQEGIRSAVEVAIHKNVDLIRTVKRDYFSGVRKAVFTNFEGLAQPEGRTLLQQIQHVGQVSKSRSKVIARDQAQKLNSNFNKIRQTDSGIDSYKWRNSQDRRVVGNPSGLYPKPTRLHGDHWRREGKIFRWDDPPGDGHPGEPIMCRCVAEPIVDREKILENTEIL